MSCGFSGKYPFRNVGTHFTRDVGRDSVFKLQSTHPNFPVRDCESLFFASVGMCRPRTSGRGLVVPAHDDSGESGLERGVSDVYDNLWVKCFTRFPDSSRRLDANFFFLRRYSLVGAAGRVPWVDQGQGQLIVDSGNVTDFRDFVGAEMK